MARNGSGTYARASASYVYNTIIDQVAVNAELDDIATALTNSLTKNGETTATANQPMGTYRHTGVGNGVARTDYAAMGQVQDGTLNWVDGGGTADAITATYSPAITALVDGQICCVRATAANATTTPTFAPNGLTARTIVKTGGVALVAGDIVGDGHELILRYLLASTRWELLNPAVNAANALLAGSASQAFAALAVNTAKTTVASATTPDIFAVTTGQLIDYTGTATCTGFVAAPQAGMFRELYCAGACLFTAGANLLIEGIPSGTTITLAAGALVQVRAITTTQFKMTYSVSGTFTATGTGFVANPTVTASYTIANGVANVHIPLLSGTSNATTFTITGFPAPFTGLSETNGATLGTNNGSTVSVYIDFNGNALTLFNGITVASTSWTASGTKQLHATSVYFKMP